MRYLLIVLNIWLCAMGVFPSCFAQPPKKLEQQLSGSSWNVYKRDKSSQLEESLLKEMQEKSRRSGNSNKAIYQFEENGGFRLISIEDYSRSDQEGKYHISEDGKHMIREVIFPKYYPSVAKKKKRKTMKNTILYLEGDYMVLKHKKTIIYLNCIKH